MKRWHPVAISVLSAVLAAVAVMGGYALLRQKKVAPPKESQTPVVHKEEIRPKKSVAPNKISSPPPGVPPAPPQIPEMIREGKPPPLPQSLPSGDELREQFALLHRFLELPPDRLARIRESIERIERMPPERKKAMLERIESTGNTVQPGALMKNSVDLRDAPESIRVKVGAIVGKMPATERNALVEKIKSYSETQRAAYFEGLVAGAEAAKSGVRQPESAPTASPETKQEAAK